ncbi:hypothetical protein F5Y15DRAFT_418446 [Xylariaceae sp. FL0016]|nr:hypothetical protein F5Y15DRAFT_418446 [Xylariaceae sp. FL0016]
MSTSATEYDKPSASRTTSSALDMRTEITGIPKEPSNQLRPMLSERHVNMMSFSQCIGIGLFLQTGRVMYLVGPGLATICYILAVRRFSWIVLISAELVAITHMFKFEYPANYLAEAGYPDATLSFKPRVSPAVFVFCFLIIMLLINMLPVRQLGRAEYFFGLTKMLFIIMMIIFNIALAIQRPAGREPMWTYNDPYSFSSHNITLPNGYVATGGGAELGAVWDGLNSCLFGLIGFETIAITAAENRDLRTEETVKIGTRENRITHHSSVISFGYGENCVFVISAVLNRLRVWPYFINDFIIFSATTAGANGVYNASRTLHALASIPDVWPDFGPIQSLRRRLERTSYGVPHAAVFFSAAFGMLGFLAVNDDSQVILGRMVRTCVTSLMITYGLMAASFLSFFNSIKAAAEGRDESIDNKDDPEVRRLYDRDHPQYPYRSHAQWLRAVYAVFGCTMLILFNGWRTFVSPMSVSDFVACYIAIIVLIAIVMLYQVKFWGWNPLNWRRRATNELQIPRPEIATSVPRRGELALLDTDNLFIRKNMRQFVRWIWVWLK